MIRKAFPSDGILLPVSHHIHVLQILCVDVCGGLRFVQMLEAMSQGDSCLLIHGGFVGMCSRDG
jgi:hypothetical protein